MKENIGSLFDKRFGTPSGGLGALGGLSVGEKLSSFGNRLKAEEMAKKDAAMKLAQERLRQKRLAMKQAQAKAPTLAATVKASVVQVVKTLEVSPAPLAEKNAVPDVKDEAMRRAIERLREKREKLPPVPREMRTR